MLRDEVQGRLITNKGSKPQVKERLDFNVTVLDDSINLPPRALFDEPKGKEGIPSDSLLTVYQRLERILPEQS
jgi:hypothetical protein